MDHSDIRMTDIVEAVADEFDITVDDLKGQSRARDFSVPRQISYYLICQIQRYSLPRIGRFFGGRDHTTIMHGVRRTREKHLKEHSEKISNIETRIGPAPLKFVRSFDHPLVFRSKRGG